MQVRYIQSGVGYIYILLVIPALFASGMCHGICHSHQSGIVIHPTLGSLFSTHCAVKRYKHPYQTQNSILDHHLMLKMHCTVPLLHAGTSHCRSPHLIYRAHLL